MSTERDYWIGLPAGIVISNGRVTRIELDISDAAREVRRDDWSETTEATDAATLAADVAAIEAHASRTGGVVVINLREGRRRAWRCLNGFARK